MRFRGFGAGATRVFDELAANNRRDWQANRHRYEAEVREDWRSFTDLNAWLDAHVGPTTEPMTDR
ncbi:MAG TPA: DUF2461 family protein [Acidimicrobiales bacterium]